MYGDIHRAQSNKILEDNFRKIHVKTMKKEKCLTRHFLCNDLYFIYAFTKQVNEHSSFY